MKYIYLLTVSVFLTVSSYAAGEIFAICKASEEELPNTVKMVHKSRNGDATDDQVLFVSKEKIITEKQVASAYIENVERVSVTIEFTEEGQEKFAELTKASVGKRLALLVRGELASAPIVREPISGHSLIIDGFVSKDEAKKFIAVFNKK